MNSWQVLLPTHPFVWPMMFVTLIYGLRYLAMAALAYRVARPTPQGGWGRPHRNAPLRFAARQHIRRELGNSLISLAIFGAVNGVLFGWGLIQHSLVYFRISAYPVWWFVLSIPVMVILHDTLFYWLHRAMHTRLLFGLMHKVHHQSTHPTVFAAYSFHPTEALAEALIVTVIVYVIPAHPLALLIFQTFSTAYNIYGHCGREFYPVEVANHPLGRWVNTSTAHAAHHGQGRYNYGFYFMFWDRLMGTTDPKYGQAS
ncbi:sterol desaturase family protein [Roseateles koreensis]|uniref:Sterol desaturase family protein n=1 Tax=Roseateles koreensis TaxID=2987526 RepID=A0ABT5KTW2_9BURK|nr:sterol desaturase family protein [Roseateles koreensis]MDC8785885.1 sterol desaturase family protein [Roseateles koreensis]